SVPIFIENIVFEKSYIAQLKRSRAGASFTTGSPTSARGISIGSGDAAIGLPVEVALADSQF
ncbi:MAG: hypothetical protein ABIQ44_10460, partial [Chloroflexia bacterium]